MAEDIGEAQIAIRVALEQLQKGMQDAAKVVQEAIDDINKKAVVKFDANAANIKNQFNGISNVVNEAGDDIQRFSNGSSSVIRELSNQIFGLTTSFVGMGAGVTAAAGPIAIIVAGVAVLVGEIALVIKFISDVTDKVKLYVGQNEELSNALNTVTDVAKLLWNGLTDIYDALRDKVALAIVDLIEGLVDTWKEMNNATGAGDGLLASLKNLVSSGFNIVMTVVDTVIKILNSFSGASADSQTKVDNLTAVVNTLGVVLNGVSFVINNVSRGIQIMGNWAAAAIEKLEPVITKIKELLGFIAQLTAYGLTSVFGLNTERSTPTDTSGIYGPEQGNRSFGDKEYGPGNLSGKNQFNLESMKDKGGSKGRKEKEVDLEKEELKVLNEIIRAYEEQVSLIEKKIVNGTADLKQRDDLLKKFREELESRKLILEYSDNVLTADLKLEDIKTKQIKSEQEILKLQQESYKEIVGKAGKEAESIKDYLNANVEAERKLKGLKLQDEGDLQKIAIFNIEEKYRKEIQSINQSRIAEENKIKTVAELEKKQLKEIKAIRDKDTFDFLNVLQNGFNDVTSAIGSGFRNMMQGVFGEINSLFEQLMASIYEQLIVLAANEVFQAILTVLTGGAGGGLLGGIWSGIKSLFGFGPGGFTGVGNDDEPAGIVHRNEFVVSSAGTSIPGNRELLEAMNRGEDVASLIGRYEKRYVSSESIRSEALNSISASDFAGDRSVNVNIDGVNVNAKIQKLTGLSENDWSQIVDEDLIPQISKGLKRAGKEVLDNTIN